MLLGVSELRSPTREIPSLARSFSDYILGQNELMHAPSLRLKGTTRMEIRGRKRKQEQEAETQAETTIEPLTKRPNAGENKTKNILTCDDDHTQSPPVSVPDTLQQANADSSCVIHEDSRDPRHQVLRISAGRAAAAAGWLILGAIAICVPGP